MKKVIFTLFLVLGFTKSNTQTTDYNADLFLPIASINGGNYCGYYAPNYNPGDVFQYGANGFMDLKKLYNVAYRTNTTPGNRNQTFWTTFGGFGHPTQPGVGFIGKIDDNKKDNVANGIFGNGVLKFTNVRIQGTGPTSTWTTSIWINVFSQCHNACNQGAWWKYQSTTLTRDQSRQFANTHNFATTNDSYINGSNSSLIFQGNPACNANSVYGFGSGEVN
jgi:hypothetical protein